MARPHRRAMGRLCGYLEVKLQRNKNNLLCVFTNINGGLIKQNESYHVQILFVALSADGLALNGARPSTDNANENWIYVFSTML